MSEEAVYFYTVSAVVVGAGFAPGCGADSERRRAGGDRQSGETGIDRQKRASERSAAVSPPSLHSLYLSTLSPPPLSLSLSLLFLSILCSPRISLGGEYIKIDDSPWCNQFLFTFFSE